MLSPLQKNHNKEKGGCQKKTFPASIPVSPFSPAYLPAYLIKEWIPSP
jgi:hypothetical protein